MRVEELIEQLREMPPGAQVMLRTYENGWQLHAVTGAVQAQKDNACNGSPFAAIECMSA